MGYSHDTCPGPVRGPPPTSSSLRRSNTFRDVIMSSTASYVKDGNGVSLDKRKCAYAQLFQFYFVSFIHPFILFPPLSLLGKNISFARFTLILVLNTVKLNKFMSIGTLALLLMMNLADDHTLLAHVKQFQKNLYCCHSSDTLWTLQSASFFNHAPISPHITYASPV